MTLRREAIQSLVQRLFQSKFVRDTSLLTFVALLERVGALVQAIIIANILGITKYGIYGLLITTLGFVSSVSGLQMGLTATVFLARYREHEKEKAAAVISHVMRFGWWVALALILVVCPFAQPVSRWLLKADGYALVVSLSACWIAIGLVSGIQNGVVQGFEDFRSLSIAQVLGTIVPLTIIYPVARVYSLLGVVIVLLLGAVGRFIFLRYAMNKNRKAYQIPKHGSGVSFWQLVWEFSFPSMLVSLATGWALWYGAFLLTRQKHGFDQMGLVNVGQQWRGPILFVAAKAATVAIPRFSRHFGAGEEAESRSFRSKLLWANGGLAFFTCASLIAVSPWLLTAYGKGFETGHEIFMILVASTVPMILSNIYMQEMVARGTVWLQFMVHIPAYIVVMISFLWLVPRYSGLGYATSLFFFGLVLFVTVSLLYRIETKKPEPTQTLGENS